MKSEKKSIVVVLGMHRSGTSAVTRALEVLGVDLGTRLMPPAPGNNEKGFFEDIDVNAINIELLAAVGQEWHTLTLVPTEQLLQEKLAHLRLRAIDLLRGRLKDVDCFGMKDPRMCRLLPFWQKVFEYLQLSVSYVIAVRNPISVAKSLEKRDGLPPEKSHYLWLEHVLPSMMLTRDARRVLVDYDLLLADPAGQIARMAEALGYSPALDAARLAEFSSEFLDEGLRHASFDIQDVLIDPRVPTPVRTAVTLLNDLATDKTGLQDAHVEKTLRMLADQVEGMAQALEYLLRLDQIIAHHNIVLAERNNSIGALNQSLAEREARISVIQQAVEKRDGEIAALSQATMEREGRIAALSQMATERDERLIALSQGIAERDAQIGQLGQQAAARDAQIAALGQEIAGRDSRISELGQSITARDGRIDQLTQEAAARDAQIAALGQEVAGRDGRIEQLTQDAAAREAQVAALGQEIAGRDGRIEQLTQEAAARDAQIAVLGQEIAGRDGRIDQLTQEVAAREARIAVLGQELAGRDGRIDQLTQEATAREAQIAGLAQEIAGRDSRIEQLSQESARTNKHLHDLHVSTLQSNYRFKALQASLAWTLFKPVRLATSKLSSLAGKMKAGLLPLDQIEPEGDAWRATGNDAKFLLVAERAWHGMSGWYMLSLESSAPAPLNAQLIYDAGSGFDSANIIHFTLPEKGVQNIALFVPQGCRAIRLDPCDMATSFKLTVCGLKRLAKAPEFSADMSSQFARYEALGARDGNATALEPVSALQKHCEDDFSWRADGEDPWFLLPELPRKLRAGWYMIELRVRADVGRANAKFYFDFGEGYNEAASVTLPFVNGQISKRLCYLPSAPKQVRFDPMEGAAKFTVFRLHFSPVSNRFAHQRMLRRLSNRSSYHKGKTTWVVWRELRAVAKNKKISTNDLLVERYNQTFRTASGQANIGDGYEEWIKRVEVPEFTALDAASPVSDKLALKPTFSVVMPTYNTGEEFLRKAIDSVLAQSYPHWELCIADDASPKAHVRAILEEYAARDPRIKVTVREKNGHISAASNSALALATGDYVALLDHDDELARHALFFCAQAINARPSAQVLYSDEDKIDEKGQRTDPHFKPDWNPDLFLAQNYVSHLGIYRRSLIERIGGFRLGVEGSQDQDLLLRCLPHVDSEDIVHIPKVLYHWRILEGSTARAAGEKSYTTEAGIKVLREFFTAQGRDDIAVETGLVTNTYRVRYPVPQPEPLVSLLIPTRDKLDLLEPCIRSIREKTTYQNYEIIILDNESVEPATHEYFQKIQVEDTRIKVLPYPYPFNYSSMNNFGVQHAKGEVIGLVNNDIEVISPEWLTEMVSYALRPEIGCVGAKLYYDDETIQHAGVIIGLGGVAGHSHKHFPKSASGYFHRLKLVQNLSAVTAACLLVRKSVYEEVGGLEEQGLRIAFNDVDFCLKVREAGYRNLWTPYAELYHHESKSRGFEDTPEKLARFMTEIEFMKNKWGDALKLDPSYNPNLTNAREDFSLE